MVDRIPNGSFGADWREIVNLAMIEVSGMLPGLSQTIVASFVYGSDEPPLPITHIGLFGAAVTIVADPTLPSDVVEFRDGGGLLLGSIVNIGKVA